MRPPEVGLSCFDLRLGFRHCSDAMLGNGLSGLELGTVHELVVPGLSLKGANIRCSRPVASASGGGYGRGQPLRRVDRTGQAVPGQDS